jgi:hypothetical protein
MEDFFTTGHPMILTSLVLLLCQAAPDAVGVSTSTSGQEPVSSQEPTLLMEAPTWASYNMALHLIDVRGRHEEGVAQLLQLVDRADVIKHPGQASWMLAQAARALTLAGKNEEAAKYIPGARNGSRGTPFESAVDALLISFAPQSAGLDPEFLAFVAQRVNKSGESLRREYGRQSLPYLQFMIDGNQGEFSLDTRRNAVKMFFGMMQAGQGQWLGEKLLTLDSLSRRAMLLGMRPFGSVFLSTFMDSEAQLAAAESLLVLAKSAPDDSKNHVLNLLIWFLGMEAQELAEPLNESLRNQIHRSVIALVEAGYRGKNGNALRDAVKPSSSVGVLGPTFALAESSNPKVREDARWALMSRDMGKPVLREYAKSGSTMDRLRFCLAISLHLGNLRTQGYTGWQKSCQDWVFTYLTGDGIAAPFFAHQNQLDFEEEDVDVLASMASEANPFLRFLAANTLITRNHAEKAVPFFRQIGDDPRWAIYTFHYWGNSGIPIPESATELFSSLAKEGPLKQEVRALIENVGGPILTPELWLQWNLSPRPNAVQIMLSHAASSEGLVKLVLSQPLQAESFGAIALKIAKQWPLDYLAAIPQLEDIGRRWEFTTAERTAWLNGIQVLGSRVALDHEEQFGAFLFHGEMSNRDLNWLGSVAQSEPDLLIRIGLARVQDREAMVKLFSQRYGFSNNFRGLLDPAVATEFAVQLVNHKMDDLPGVVDLITKYMLDPSLEAAIPFFEGQWNQQPLSPVWGEYVVKTTMETPALRKRFRANLVQGLSTKAHAAEIADHAWRVGYVPEILNEILEEIEKRPEPASLHSMLRAISTVDDPRVVEVLLRHVDDPRGFISEEASSGLERIFSSRELKERMDRWATDGRREPMSTVAVLLKNLSDPELEIRLVSIESLGALGDKEALPALINLLRSEDEQVKTAARKALDRINKVPASPREQVKVELTLRLAELEGELAAMGSTYTEGHPKVREVMKKIEVTKEQLAELESD